MLSMKCLVKNHYTKGVSIDNANKMASELSMPDLKKMSVENRANTLSKYMSNNNAQILSQRFEDLKKVW